MITFRLVQHSVREQEQVVEVLNDGQVVAAIYANPDDDRAAIRLFSMHIRNTPGLLVHTFQFNH